MVEAEVQTLRQIAAEAGLPLAAARERLEAAGVDVPHPTARIGGRQLRTVRSLLGLGPRPGDPPPREKLTAAEIDARILRPLFRKGKVGRTHTTPIENAWGHGIPDDQKALAKERVEALLKEGILLEKVSQGRRHVYLSPAGRTRAAALRAEAARP